MNIETLLLGFFFFIIGATVGSFLNVVIYRLPKGESVVFPSSHCPNCNTAIRIYDNLPILGYLFLGGRCRDCKMPIGIQYPLVELITGLLFVGIFAIKGIDVETPFYLVFISALVVIFTIDLKHYIIPDVITLPGIALGLLYSFLHQELLSALIGAAGGFLFFYGVAWLSLAAYKKEGMGGGDIKLAAMLGAWLGWQLLIVGLFISFLLGAALGLIFLKFLKDRLFPFGTALALGGGVALLWGEGLFQWYLALIYL